MVATAANLLYSTVNVAFLKAYSVISKRYVSTNTQYVPSASYMPL